ncbi:envelope glycoprotein [Sesbania bispinosa]|nr:envelope glycoprotein [Sesbania bispinosa]
MPKKVDNLKSNVINGIQEERDKIKRETLLFEQGDVPKELRIVKTFKGVF